MPAMTASTQHYPMSPCQYNETGEIRVITIGEEKMCLFVLWCLYRKSKRLSK